MAALALSTYLVVNFSVVKQLESHAFSLVRQLGDGIIAEAQQHIVSTETLALSLASMASTVSEDTPEIRQAFLAIIDSAGADQLIAGGGVWPEPHALDPMLERKSFFWGRNIEGTLEFYDSYNDPESKGYHNEEWYVPVKFLPPKGVYWSRSYIDPYSKEPMTTCSAPIYKKDQFWGVATIDIKLSAINRGFQNFSSEQGSYAFAISGDGSIMSFPDDYISKVFKASGEFIKAEELPDIDPAFAEMVSQIRVIDEAWIDANPTTFKDIEKLAPKLAEQSYQISEEESVLIAAQILSSHHGSESVPFSQYLSKYDPITKGESIVTIQSIPEIHGKLISVRNYQTLKQKIFGLYWTLTYLFLGLFSGAILLSVMILHRTFMKPLTSMRDELQNAISKQSFISSELSYNRQDELGTLARLFNIRTRRLNKTLKQLTHSKEKEQKANHAKSDFLATMTHEIRTPLHGISGYTNLLFDTRMDSEQDEYTRAIMANTDALMSVIDNILDISKIESNKMEVEKHPFGIRECLDDLSNLMAPKAAEKNLGFSIKVSDRVPAKVIGDRQRLRQVLINLTSNAVKFTQQGFVNVHLDAEYEGDKVVLKFKVIDTGIGIPQNVISKLFTPFTQADNSTTRKFGGSGLGLAICKRLIEAMEGVVCLESEVGEGSCFAFNIKVGACTTHEIRNKGLPSERVRDYATWGTDFPLNILIAEDNPANQKLIARILNKMAYQPEFAENGKMALNKLKDKQFDLILMDNLMPEMNGIEASLAIRKGHVGEDKRNTPIIAVTANAFHETRKQCLEAGMDGFLSKPVKVSELAETLEIAYHQIKDSKTNS